MNIKLASPEVEKLRELYYREGISYLPKVLELVDKNRLSPTYGCFDRSYWHYRTSDFPCGMAQEAVLALAMAYYLQAQDNPYQGQERISELVVAGIDFARRSSHADGSCDDYFPYERAAGATAFSLYAFTESYLLLGLKQSTHVEFFERRARYLAGSGFRESGILSNHKALIVLCLYNTFLVTQNPVWRDQAKARLEALLNLQSEEGWFPEYQGCDPGYLTFTVDFLAKYFSKSKDDRVRRPLLAAIEFSSHFMHPDGSYGGEYGSRNTFHFMPHGYELMGRDSPIAIRTVNQFLRGMKNGTRSYLDDDRIFVHYAYNFLQAYRDFCAERKEPAPDQPEGVKYFEKAKLAVKRSRRFYAVVSLAKGGVGKYYKDGVLSLSDCGLVGETTDGKKFTSQMVSDFQWEIRGEQITISGSCYAYRTILFTPFRFILFRLFNTMVGRFLSPNFIRSVIQRIAITRRPKKVPIRFKKEIDLSNLDWIRYTLDLEDSGIGIKELWVGSDPTFIYVATSQPYQAGNLRPWRDLSEHLDTLNTKRTVTFQIPIS
ncbi:MAG: hypothetical protein NC930_00470 [Candidatus Omnitrophica bacterium]|nr:hypothetical protein [Candidatus Omnitrophota bacterium]